MPTHPASPPAVLQTFACKVTCIADALADALSSLNAASDAVATASPDAASSFRPSPCPSVCSEEGFGAPHPQQEQEGCDQVKILAGVLHGMGARPQQYLTQVRVWGAGQDPGRGASRNGGAGEGVGCRPNSCWPGCCTGWGRR